MKDNCSVQRRADKGESKFTTGTTREHREKSRDDDPNTSIYGQSREIVHYCPRFFIRRKMWHCNYVSFQGENQDKCSTFFTLHALKKKKRYECDKQGPRWAWKCDGVRMTLARVHSFSMLILRKWQMPIYPSTKVKKKEIMMVQRNATLERLKSSSLLQQHHLRASPTKSFIPFLIQRSLFMCWFLWILV